MREYRFWLVNVFAIAGQPFSGNPLCVFEDGRGLSSEMMQALALQFNLSETTFILPSGHATAGVRIFTPSFEMPFAGHPTLGTAYVVRALRDTGDSLSLEMKAGVIPVTAAENVFSLRANAPSFRAVGASDGELAAMLGLDDRDLAAGARWVDAGSEQLVVPLASADAVRRCRPHLALLEKHGAVNEARCLVYVFAETVNDEVTARFFFRKGTAVVEDPATGSACANLGGWYLASGATLPLAKTVHQGDAVGRPSLLSLRVERDRSIYVSGRVIELGRGAVHC